MKQSLARGCWLALALCGAAVTFALAAPGAEAVSEHSFDAGLSLEGGCKGTDGIPDPGCPGGEHPAEPFNDACGTAVDRNGDIYVASGATNGGVSGRIDVFDAQGSFLSEIKDEHQPCSLAVDSEGNLYVAEYQGKNAVLFEPKTYPPQKGEEYTATIIYDHSKELGCGEAWGGAVDPSDDHLYLALGCMIAEYDSVANGSGLIREGIASFLPVMLGIDVSGQSHDLYLTSAVPGSAEGQPKNARLYVLDPTGKTVKCEASGFSFFFGHSGVGVDQANGDAYVDDMTSNHAVKQFDSGCAPLGQLSEAPFLERPSPFADIAVDDPCLSGVEPCNPTAPYESPNEGYVFLGSGEKASKSHLYAYAPIEEPQPPAIEAQGVSGVSGSEARLEAKVNPRGSETTYHFEYVTEAQFAESGYAEAASTPEEGAGAFGSPVAVSSAVSGLLPGTAYRFRAVASNCESREVETGCLTVGEGKPGEEGKDASFATYPAPAQQSCPNEALRTGPSAALPDCRAYELVTPAQTNGRTPTMNALAFSTTDGFDTDLASADGESLSFGVEGGSLSEGEGGGLHDTYVAQRGPGGWQSEFSGLRGAETAEPYVGGIAPDNRYSFWLTRGDVGSLAKGNYLRGPGGTVEPIGLGSLGSDLEAEGRLITAGGGHVIFVSSAHLEPDAPPVPPPPAVLITAIYDRAVGGPTQVLSLLPGDEVPSSSAQFLGASSDGGAVAFEVAETLYLRRGGQTQEVVAGDPVFGGISTGGGRLTYLQPQGITKGLDPPHGDIFSYDAGSATSTAVGSGGESILVNVSADGSHVFFASPKQLVEGEGTPGAENLYVWDADTEAIGFLATLTERDVLGEKALDENEAMTDGLGLWVNKVLDPIKRPTDGPGADPSRSTAEGSVFLFESRAPLTPYASEGRAEIYRYSEAEGLSCISCNPTGTPAGSDARLQGPNPPLFSPLPPVNSLARIANLSADGQVAFFQSAEPLTAADNDGKIDVYEWEAAGRGGCGRPGGCLALISSPNSGADEYLYAATPSAHDVFIETAEALVPSDPDGGPSIYDAREGGGFAEATAPEPCGSADACRSPSPPPALPSASSGPFPGQNASPKKGARCPKGKHKARTRGKTRCVKGHGAKKHQRHGRAER